MTALLPACLAALAISVALSREDASSRLPAVVLRRRMVGAAVQVRAEGPDRRLMTGACLLAAAAAVLLVAGPVGWALGAGLGLMGPAGLRRLQPPAGRVEDEEATRDLPLALDLLAACLSGGASLHQAVAAVAAAVPGPCGGRLGRVAGALAVGTPPPEAWQQLAGAHAHGPAASAARALARAADGGAPVAASASRIAAAARAEAASTAMRAARRAGVLAVGPLGLCFLPAFVLLGVVPAVVGLAAPLLTGL